VQRTALVALLSLLCLYAPLTANANCVDGHVALYSANQGAVTPAQAWNFNIKWCLANPDGTPNIYSCTVAHTLDSAGNFDLTDLPGASDAYYFPYIWSDSVSWGSSTYPALYALYIPADCGGAEYHNNVGTIYTYPRATPPSAVYPANGAHDFGTGSFTLQWTDGLDAGRRSPYWPVTYDIYGAGNGARYTKEYSDIPCGGSNGVCSATIPGPLVYNTRYTWYVVAKITDAVNVYAANNGAVNRTYQTTSPVFTFSTTWNPSIPVHNILTYNGNYLKAVDGGGGAFDGTGTSSTYETQFQFNDVTNQTYTIWDGDQINIRTNRNWYVSAQYGGGYGTNAASGWNMGYETWTVHKVGGAGPINPGDQFYLQSFSGYYMSAEGGGGGQVNTNRTDVGPWETFTMQ